MGEVDIVELFTNGQDILEELLDVVSGPADDTLSTLPMETPVMGDARNCVEEWTRSWGPLLLFPSFPLWISRER